MRAPRQYARPMRREDCWIGGSGIRKQRRDKLVRYFNDYELAELLTGLPLLLAGEGFYDASAPGVRVSQKRDVAAMRRAWQRYARAIANLARWLEAVRQILRLARAEAAG